ncbi:hypothetical protein GCM10010406_22710 [Streptomyces thermolineatus]|uniref:Uncharacterized protein n=1 Tax=Streptomyces thermolineatus TaxID=44033 RepID=A0ABN3LKI9_9ACTN
MHSSPGQQSDDPAENPQANRGDGTEGPGASSGSESDAQRRTVPGTASADEGYRPGEGTAGGEQLAGVEADREEAEEDRSGA